MDIIKLTRDLGRAIQQDERYLKYRIASQNNDEDETLQNMIGAFNLTRMNLNTEIQKGEPDERKVEELNKKVRELYKSIMVNPNMATYNEAKQDFDQLIKRITTIILQSANGEDPETTDLRETSCTGSCETCFGCN